MANDIVSLCDKEWADRGGATGVMGETITGEFEFSDRGSFQRFKQGVVFYSEIYGLQVMSNSIFEIWEQSENEQKVPVKNILGMPITSTQSLESSIENSSNRTYIIFEAGIVFSNAVIVYGADYFHYQKLGGVSGRVGLPFNGTSLFSGNTSVSYFDNGKIHSMKDEKGNWNSSFISDRNIETIWQSQIREEDFLGNPTSDEQPILGSMGQEIGACTRFEGGAIVRKGARGIMLDWVRPIRSDFLTFWETEYFGANGPLGFPSGFLRRTPIGIIPYQEYDGGIIFITRRSGEPQIRALQGIEIKLIRIELTGDDEFGLGSRDGYVEYSVSLLNGWAIEERSGRIPETDNFGNQTNPDILLARVERIENNCNIVIKIDAFDDDSTPISSKRTHIGSIKLEFNIENLWRIDHPMESESGSLKIACSSSPRGAADPKQFRKDLFWKFDNFKTPQLTFNQYASTFMDVEPDESSWRHPLNRLFYNLAYKDLASSGNCFGMCLEAIYACVGRSAFSLPLHQHGPNRGDEPDLVHDANLINEINIKHGYQIGSDAALYVMNMAIHGRLHDPISAFMDVRNFLRQGEYPIICLSSEFWSSGGHAVLPYRIEGGPETGLVDWKIYVANPNSADKTDDHQSNVIVINSLRNEFRIDALDDGNVWIGETWKGGRLFAMPFRLFRNAPETPTGALLNDLDGLTKFLATFMIIGESSLMQITDNKGRTFFDESVPDRNKWNAFHKDPNRQIPGLVLLPLFTKLPNEATMIVSDSTQAQLHYRVLSGITGMRSFGMRTGWGQATLEGQGMANTSDIISFQRTKNQFRSLAVTTEAPLMTNVQISQNSPFNNHSRQFVIQKLQLQEDHGIALRLTGGGSELILQNIGPRIDFKLTIRCSDEQGQGSVFDEVSVEESGYVSIRPDVWSGTKIHASKTLIGVPDTVLRSFSQTIFVNASMLSSTTFMISESDKKWHKTMNPISTELNPGMHEIRTPACSAGSSLFKVSMDGRIEINLGSTGYLAGHGTTTLVVTGYSIVFDCRGLSVARFLLVGLGIDWLPTEQPATLRLLPGNYEVYSPAASPETVVRVTHDGRLDYESKYDGYLAGRGTTTLVVTGYSIVFDFTVLGSIQFTLTGLDVGWLHSMQRQQLQILPGAYSVQLQGRHSDLVFSVSNDGLVILDDKFGDILAGHGSNILTIRK